MKNIFLILFFIIMSSPAFAGGTNSSQSTISISQAVPGTTNAVAIDQSTPGTTNNVNVGNGFIPPANGSAYVPTSGSYTNLPMGLSTVSALPSTTNGNVYGAIADTSGRMITVSGAQYPVFSTPIAASSGNVAASSAVATLSGTSGKTTYISGFQCTGSGSTSASVVTIAITGTVSGTNLSYTFTSTAGVLLGDTPITQNFNPAIPASAANTNIVVTMPSLGTGNTNAACNAYGYQL